MARLLGLQIVGVMTQSVFITRVKTNVNVLIPQTLALVVPHAILILQVMAAKIIKMSARAVAQMQSVLEEVALLKLLVTVFPQKHLKT